MSLVRSDCPAVQVEWGGCYSHPPTLPRVPELVREVAWRVLDVAHLLEEVAHRVPAAAAVAGVGRRAMSQPGVMQRAFVGRKLEVHRSDLVDVGKLCLERVGLRGSPSCSRCPCRSCRWRHSRRHIQGRSPGPATSPVLSRRYRSGTSRHHVPAHRYGSARRLQPGR
jgi:hypothetical protein